MNRSIIFVSVIVILAGGVVVLTRQNSSDKTLDQADQNKKTATSSTFVLPPPPDDQITKTFSHSNPNFSFKYPAVFSLTEGARPGFEGNWSSLSQATGTVYTTLTLPKSFEPNTNFSEATITFGSSDISTSTCTNLPQEMKTEEVKLGGVVFVKAKMSDAGAGNYYDSTLYRGLVGGQCLAIESTIHSTNIGVYEEGTVTEFNQRKADEQISRVLLSITF